MQRTDPASGGIQWFAEDMSAQLDVLPVQLRLDRPVTAQEADAFIQKHRTFWTVLDKRDFNLPSGVGGWQATYQPDGYKGQPVAVIRFMYRLDQLPLDALHAIHKANIGAIPNSILIAATAATFIRRRGRVGEYQMLEAPTLLTLLREGGMNWTAIEEQEKPASRGEIMRLVRNMLPNLLTGEEPNPMEAPTSPITMARIWMALGEELWKADAIRDFARIPFGGDGIKLAAALAMIWHETVEGLVVELNGTHFDAKKMHANFAWPELLYMKRMGLTAQETRFLNTNSMMGSALIAMGKLPTIDRNYALGIARSLVRRATENQIYEPFGQFILRLPDSLGWHQAGITSLVVVARADCLIAAGLTQRGVRSNMWEWKPEYMDQPERATRDTEATSPFILATMAALWHDLVVAGEEVIVEAQRDKARNHKEQAGDKEPLPHYLDLPRKQIRYLGIAGSRQWGNSSDREIIHKQTHGVRWQKRRLPDGYKRSDEAEGNAEEYGVILPDGYTFVMPHIRGGKKAKNQRPTIARARGLQTIAALLNAE